MKKQVLYTYLGTNGSLVTPIHLEGIYSVKKYKLQADPGKKLTKDGLHFVELVLVHELEVDLWHEVDGQK